MVFAPQQDQATGERPATQAAIGGAACNTSGKAVLEADVAVVEDNGNDGGGNGGADGGAEPPAAAASAAPTNWEEAASIFGGL